MARRIAHEIKNPLTPIQLSAERLRKKYRKDIPTADLEVFDRCNDTIIRQVDAIRNMVDEFSAFARMPAPKFADQDASELIRAAVFDASHRRGYERSLLQAVNDALKAARSDGTYDTIYEKWIGAKPAS